MSPGGWPLKKAKPQRWAQGIIAPLAPSIRDSRGTKPGKLETRDSHRAKLVRYAVESVGSKVSGDPVFQRGHKFLISCDANPTIEKLLVKRLKASLGDGTKLHRIDGRLWIQFLDRSARVGRPSDTEDLELAEKLRGDGLSYRKIAHKIFKDTGRWKSPDAYRKMLNK
jgi:hypothetical protein